MPHPFFKSVILHSRICVHCFLGVSAQFWPATLQCLNMDSLILATIWNTCMQLYFSCIHQLAMSLMRGYIVVYMSLWLSSFPSASPCTQSKNHFETFAIGQNLTMESSHAASPISPTMDDTALKPMTVMTAPAGHMMAANDPDNPQNWPVQRKIYASAVAFAFTWVV